MGLQFWAQDPVQPGSQDLETSERFWGWLLRLCLQSLEEKRFPEIKKKKKKCLMWDLCVSILLGDHTEGTAWETASQQLWKTAPKMQGRSQDT